MPHGGLNAGRHKFLHLHFPLQVFHTFDKDRSNSLELPEIMQMCRQLFNMSFNEACFVQVRGSEDVLCSGVWGE